jgi:hypothetical protein
MAHIGEDKYMDDPNACVRYQAIKEDKYWDNLRRSIHGHQ